MSCFTGFSVLNLFSVFSSGMSIAHSLVLFAIAEILILIAYFLNIKSRRYSVLTNTSKQCLLITGFLFQILVENIFHLA